jgi:hypothetical protein
MSIRRKKIKNNEYVKTENNNIWIRDFCNLSAASVDVNTTIKETEYFLFLKNEFQNNLKKYQWIDSGNNNFQTGVIISDGYDFEEVHKTLEKKNQICFFGVNNSLKKWKNENTSLNFYIVNNPYEECLRFLPTTKKSLPTCIASNRTNPEFLKQYNGIKYRYSPANEEGVRFNRPSDVYFQIDDYRNPVCASINLAYRFGCEKILILCCDDSFKENKPGSVLLDNNFYTYPQQNIANEIVDCYLYWFLNSGRQAAYHSSGKKLNNAEYIKKEDINNYILT